MIATCADHVEIALDEFVDTYEEPPEMELITESKVEIERSVKCHFCEKEAQFLLRKPEPTV